jgi:molybdenum cofactor cytidylyltransferase
MADVGRPFASELAAVVLAAGDSTRMGVPKALLRAPGGDPFVVQICRAFVEAGVGPLAVVTGTAHDLIVEAVGNADLSGSVRLVRNPDPGRGQLSSLWTGMDVVLTPATEALLMTLVDVPMLSARTVEAVVDGWRRSRAPIVRPAVGNAHGHPVLFDRPLFDELRHAPLEGGAKTVVRRHESRILNVVPPDDGCLRDIDTPGDYRALVG